MPCKITPQDIREKQLHDLASADGYSFMGWVDTYDTNRSKAIFNCVKHGTWSAPADAFAVRGTRCKACGYEKNSINNRVSQTTREEQLRELAEADGYTFVGWVAGYKNNQSKAIIRCADHGEWSVTISSFTSHGSRCKDCGEISRAKLRRFSQEKLRHKLIAASTERNLLFIDFVGEYRGVEGRVTMECVVHGRWDMHIGQLIYNGNGCKECGVAAMTESRLISRDTREKQLRELAEADGYSFVGFSGEYAFVNSKITMKCNEHGEWVTGLNGFVNGGRRCPSCATPGYSPSKFGTLYSLLSDCGTMIKIGISNQPNVRHRQLTSETPFTFTVYRQLHCEDGSQPPMLERMFHDRFPSAGLRGFDGATEWRHMSPDVTTWLDLLGAQ